jgi:hypothetical protein
MFAAIFMYAWTQGVHAEKAMFPLFMYNPFGFGTASFH